MSFHATPRGTLRVGMPTQNASPKALRFGIPLASAAVDEVFVRRCPKGNNLLVNSRCVLRNLPHQTVPSLSGERLDCMAPAVLLWAVASPPRCAHGEYLSAMSWAVTRWRVAISYQLT